MRRALVAGLAVLLAACTSEPPATPASPALWAVTGPRGEQAWLFGTIHALESAVDWRTEKIRKALAATDRLVVEVTGLDDPKAMGEIFERLAHSPGLPPLESRIAADQRAQLAGLVRQSGGMPDEIRTAETWAAALWVARIASKKSDTQWGVDRALLAEWRGRPVTELEGAEPQLRIFDALPEAEQRDLLEATIAEAATGDTGPDLARAWARGDMAAIGRETSRGILADPELRAALLVNRNRDWLEQITALLKTRERPFIAVGAAHLAGPDGLPAMLAARGFAVVRVQ